MHARAGFKETFARFRTLLIGWMVVSSGTRYRGAALGQRRACTAVGQNFALGKGMPALMIFATAGRKFGPPRTSLCSLRAGARSHHTSRKFLGRP